MDRQAHLDVDKYFWNKEYEDVHSWLDSGYPAFVGRNPYKHWLEKHHQEAITMEYGAFTPKYNAAYVHILMDFMSHFGVAFVPKNRGELEEMLTSLNIL